MEAKEGEKNKKTAVRKNAQRRSGRAKARPLQ